MAVPSTCPYCKSPYAADGKVNLAQRPSDGAFSVRCPRCDKFFPGAVTLGGGNAAAAQRNPRKVLLLVLALAVAIGTAVTMLAR